MSIEVSENDGIAVRRMGKERRDVKTERCRQTRGRVRRTDAGELRGNVAVEKVPEGTVDAGPNGEKLSVAFYREEVGAVDGEGDALMDKASPADVARAVSTDEVEVGNARVRVRGGSLVSWRAAILTLWR